MSGKKKITVDLELSSPYELSPKEIERDIRMAEDQIGWNYDYVIKRVDVIKGRIAMIKVEKAESHRCCNSCHTRENVLNITVYGNETNQGTQISLCDACVKEMIIKYTETIETQSGEDK